MRSILLAGAVALCLVACVEPGEPDDRTATSPLSCGAPAYAPGAGYDGGDRVRAGDAVYECKPWPQSGWCGAGAAYAPGTGWAWPDAWILIGACGEPEPEPEPEPEEPEDDDWQLANLTWFTSYPDPGSEECTEYNGCQWAGYFAFIDGQRSEQWVASHNIAAVHSAHGSAYALKTLRLRQDGREIDVTVYDVCSDSDCSGCCTANMSDTGFLIDLESYTMERFGSGWGIVEWRCLDCD